MEKVVLKATRRNVIGKQVGALRREGKLPAVLYGHKFESTPVIFDLREVTKALTGLTSSSLVTIELDGKEHAALVREKQRNYVKGVLLHVDFQVVSLTEKIRASVMVDVQGTAPAVKNFGGVVVYGANSIDVECLPRDLPERFVVDISGLEDIGDSIYVRDLDVPTKVNVLTTQDEMLVVITGATAEVEAVEGEGGEMAEPEVIERGKKDEEEEE